MRILLIASMATDKANQLAKEGTLGRTVQTILEDLQPEAAYFTDDRGQRAGYLFVDIKDSSEIPKLCEPWFLAFDAQIELHPVMNPQEFGKAEAAITRAVKQYAKGA